MINIFLKMGKNKKRFCSNSQAGKNKFNMYYFVLSLVALATFVFPGTSHAYLDPGTGSFVFQMIIAGVVGGLFTIKTFWRKIISFFKKDNEK